MADPTKPLPRITAINRPFFEGCDTGEFRLQRCEAEGCGRYIYFPRICCPHCGGGTLSWTAASGKGRIRSYTVIRRPQHRSFFTEAPYIFLAVTLEEGPLIYSRLLGSAEDEAGLIGREVEVTFVEHADGHKLPFFQLL